MTFYVRSHPATCWKAAFWPPDVLMLLSLGGPDPLNFQSTQEMTHVWGGSVGGMAEVTEVQRLLFWRGWKWKWKSLSPVWLFATPQTIQSIGILQARVLEWVAFPYSWGSSQPWDRTQVFTSFARWTTREAFEEGTWILLETERPMWGVLSYKNSRGVGGRNGKVCWTLGGVFHAIVSLWASSNWG